MDVTRDAMRASESAAVRLVPEGRRLGLIIGIDTYSQEIPPLSAAVADARIMHAAMTDPECGRFVPEHTTLLTDIEATDSRIRQELERLRKIATPADEIWFYYAGHALIVDGDHRLLPVNANREFLDATSVDFSAQFRKIQCRRKIVFLDCCHAGAADTTTRNMHDVDEVFRTYQANGTLTYCSSDGDQKSVELPEHGHGAFTYWLARGLRGEADADQSGVVTSDELWQYVCAHVEADARRLTGRTQTPRLKADTSGAFALSLNATALHRQDEQEAARVASERARAERFEEDKHLLDRLLGMDELTSLSTDEGRRAIAALKEESKTALNIRKALDQFRSNEDATDAVLRIRGSLTSMAPRPSQTAEIERRVRAQVIQQLSGSVPVIRQADAPKTADAAAAKSSVVPSAASSAASLPALSASAEPTRSRKTSQPFHAKSSATIAPSTGVWKKVTAGCAVVIAIVGVLKIAGGGGEPSLQAIGGDTIPAFVPKAESIATPSPTDTKSASQASSTVAPALTEKAAPDAPKLTAAAKFADQPKLEKQMSLETLAAGVREALAIGGDAKAAFDKMVEADSVVADAIAKNTLNEENLAYALKFRAALKPHMKRLNTCVQSRAAAGTNKEPCT